MPREKNRQLSRDEVRARFERLLPDISHAAWECGYAITVHGSMSRDLDLVAIPWIERPSSADALAHEVEIAVGGYFDPLHHVNLKWHSRKLYLIYPPWHFADENHHVVGYIELSVMPTAPTIFVFGSNLAGRHGKGSAREAQRVYGAQFGVGEGRTGDAYAIPTKDAALRVLPLERIAESISKFLDYARANPTRGFRIVDVGCGLAGYDPDQIAPLFAGAPVNCTFIGKLGAKVPRSIQR